MIPEQLKKENFRFIKVKPKGKEAIEEDWQNTNNYSYEEFVKLNHKGNYGVVGGFGDLIIIDADMKIVQQMVSANFLLLSE